MKPVKIGVLETLQTGNQRKNRDHPDYSIVQLEYLEESNLRRFVVRQTTVKDH